MEDSQNTLKATNSVLQSESLSLTSILRGRAEDQNKKDSRAASLEQMRLNLKERIANLGLNPKSKESSQEESKSDSSNGYCKTHPDEALQFYCFSTNQCLCSECLLSGAFAGCDVVNIKKAGEKVRLKLEGVLREITQKTDQIAELDQEMKKKKQEITDSTLEIKTQISNLFQELVNAVQQKEQEVLEKLKNASEENLRLIEPKHKSIKDQYDEFADLKQVLEGKLSGLKEAELCQYYSSKSQLLKNFIDEKGSSIAQNLKVDGSAQNLREQFNPDHYKEVISQLQENIRDLKCPEQKMKTSDLKFFQNRTAKQSDNSRASGDILQESIPQPLAAKKSLNVYEESDTAGSSFLRPRSTSPFGTFRNGLEGTSPLPVAVTAKETPVVENQADNTLRRLFQRIEEVRKTPQPIKEEPEPRKDMRSNSFSKLSIDLQSHNASRASLADIHLQSTSKLGYFDVQKEKEPSNKFWDTYKIHIEDQSRKRLDLTPSTSLLGGFERSKTPTKSYIQEFAKSKGATGSELFKKKDLLNNTSTPSQGMSSTKNLRGLLQDEPVRPTHIKNMRSFGHEDQFKEQANEGWKLNFRRNEESSTSFGNVNKSFGSTNLNSNFLKLKKQIGLWKDE